jgi:phage tail sheath gpL-like
MTLFTLSYLRYDWRNHMLTKYPRHKLANDGTRYGSGQAIITPKVGRAEAIGKFRQWEELGLVEGADQFKRDLIVERNSEDPNRWTSCSRPTW